MDFSPRMARLLINLYPPYLGAGVKVERISEDWHTMRVSMGLRWYNRNAVGVHFGGSLYSMVDPHLMLMHMQLLGREYIVWDKSATIRFIAPGRGRVWADISLTEEDVQRAEANTRTGHPYTPCYDIDIYDQDRLVVARVCKELYIRRKRSADHWRG